MRRRTISSDCSTALLALFRSATSVSVAVTVPSGLVVTSISGCCAPAPGFTWIAASRSMRATSLARAGSETRSETRRSAWFADSPV